MIFLAFYISLQINSTNNIVHHFQSLQKLLFKNPRIKSTNWWYLQIPVLKMGICFQKFSHAFTIAFPKQKNILATAVSTYLFKSNTNTNNTDIIEDWIYIQMIFSLVVLKITHILLANSLLFGGSNTHVRWIMLIYSLWHSVCWFSLHLYFSPLWFHLFFCLYECFPSGFFLSLIFMLIISNLI